ncbi:hypothetical protein M5X00_13125 [Paenibacillus alvei]|uniref:hypothetical protein n=1 Tax=Paenibacillus alvei TaxID=44250 RepID=UPI0002887BE7|nr:hypothetical protein [Paenibacillus alvei]EJW13807.1 hypothetical protein PAV_109p00370 [Paenibacillus alvei DSM 29]MCY9540533.1 hypothetical protein [Paenibacillus alvei]MCY9708262.1 hypothetical protein [Paenibacillus alvei]MCY9732942.1 hypothetical protein [Paenibacillus alvei]MCY9755182.1 hypothetical protein [Paenibacillus alvei]
MSRTKRLMFMTNEGHRLIGEIIDPTSDFLNTVAKQIPLGNVEQMARDGIWIKRERHVTYLSNDNIKFKRAATALDREDT